MMSDQLTLFAEDSLARISASPGQGQGLPASALDYGASTPVLLASLDLAMQSLKTFPPSSAEETPTKSQLTAAYVAGLIDGEGCLWVQNKKNRWFTPRCDMGMSEKAKPVLEKLHRQFGGSLNLHRKATKKWEAAWRWAVSGKACLAMLKEIAPHLVLKGEQAKMMLAMTKRTAPTIKELISELNRKGPTVPLEAGWFARHVGGIWLTAQRDLATAHGWEEFSSTWPRSGIQLGGVAYRLPPLARLTDVTESGLLPTPTTKANQLAPSMMKWPSSRRLAERGGRGELLGYLRGTKGYRGAMLPTPTARDWRSGKASRATLERNSRPLNEVIGGSLNPRFVEQMMGFPVGWTDLEPSGTQSSRKSSS